MTQGINMIATAVALLLLAACSGGQDEEVAAGADAAQQANDGDHVWKEQVETIDRARDVEKTLKEADEAKRKAIEDAGGG